jgi:hypothetical protein
MPTMLLKGITNPNLRLIFTTFLPYKRLFPENAKPQLGIKNFSPQMKSSYILNTFYPSSNSFNLEVKTAVGHVCEFSTALIIV